MAGGSLAALAAALVYSWRGQTTTSEEESAYDAQSSELVTGFVVAGGTLAAALVYSWRGQTTTPEEESAYDAQSSELVIGF